MTQGNPGSQPTTFPQTFPLTSDPMNAEGIRRGSACARGCGRLGPQFAKGHRSRRSRADPLDTRLHEVSGDTRPTLSLRHPNPCLRCLALDTHLEVQRLRPWPRCGSTGRRSLSSGCCHWTSFSRLFQSSLSFFGLIGLRCCRRRAQDYIFL